MAKITSSESVSLLDLNLQDRHEVANRYLAESPHGGLLVDLTGPLSEGDLVELRIRLAASGEDFKIRGVVLWIRQPNQMKKAGIGFLPTETEVRERLLSSARASPATGVDGTPRCNPRYQTTLRVTYRTATDFVVDYTRNISTGGIFVLSNRPPKVGSSILFQLYPPGEIDPIDLPGEVAWRRPGQGFGVRFKGSDSSVSRRLQNLVRHVSIDAPRQVGAPVVEEITS